MADVDYGRRQARSPPAGGAKSVHYPEASARDLRIPRPSGVSCRPVSGPVENPSLTLRVSEDVLAEAGDVRVGRPSGAARPSPVDAKQVRELRIKCDLPT